MNAARSTVAGLTALLVAGLTGAPPASAKKAKLDKALQERVTLILEAGTKSGDFSARATAVSGLGFVHKERALPMVKDALDDPQWQVRRAVIGALLRLKDKSYEKAIADAVRSTRLDAGKEVLPLLEPLGVKQALATLRKALEDPKTNRPERYAAALAELGGDWLTDGFQMGLSLKNTNARAGFTDALATLPLPAAFPLYKAVIAKQAPMVQARVLEHIRTWWGTRKSQQQRTAAAAHIAMIKPLVKSKDANVAFGTAETLALAGDASGRALLIAAAKGDDAGKRLRAIRALLGVPGKDLLDVVNVYAKKDDSDADLLTAVYDINAKVGNPKLVPFLRGNMGLNSTDSLDRRAAAVQVLGRVEGASALPTLLERLTEDGAKGIRLAAARAIGDLASRDAIQTLRQRLFAETDNEVKVAILGALGAIRDPAVIPTVQSEMMSGVAEVRMAAVKALAAVNHDAAVNDLKLLLRDRDPEVRRVALNAILTLGPEKYIHLYKDSLGWIEPVDIDELAELHTKAFVAHLRLALDHDRPELREGALFALRALTPTSQADVLQQVLKFSKRADVKVQALERLVDVLNAKAVPTLTEQAKSEDKRLKVTAIAALGRLGAREAQPLLVAALDDTDERVRVTAAGALLAL